jgi:hypothetical protein
MKESIVSEQPQGEQEDPSVLVAARRAKLERLRTEFGVEPFGHRVDGITPLAQARAAFDEAAHLAYEEGAKAAKTDPSVTTINNNGAQSTVVTKAGGITLNYTTLNDNSGRGTVTQNDTTVPFE